MSTTSDQIVRHQHFSLLELLDRLLDKGVMVKGEVLLSVANIDLVYLNLGLLLSSVKSVEQAAGSSDTQIAELIGWQTSTEEALSDETQPQEADKEAASPSVKENRSDYEVTAATVATAARADAVATALPSVIDDVLEQLWRPKTDIDPEKVEKGLARLVLTLVDLIRKLMEKQAIRRVEAGQLNAKEIEKMGDTFFLLDERMEQLKTMFGLQDEDLNLDLGPLGELI